MSLYAFFISLILLAGVVAFLAIRVIKLNRIINQLRGYGEDAESSSPSEQLLRRIAELEKVRNQQEPRLQALEDTAEASIQKIGFLRFNPFHDTGGDNSFVLLLLDRTNSGAMVSSLYTREGVRIYGKSIENGRPRHVLSDEEKKVLEETIRKN